MPSVRIPYILDTKFLYYEMRLSDMGMCQYKAQYGDDHPCNEETLGDSESGLCIFHEVRKDKDKSLFFKKIEEKLEKGDYDFQGYNFPWNPQDLFKNIEMKGEINFRFAKFMDGASFENSKLIGDVSFRWIEVLGEGETNFSGVEFSGDEVTDFRWAKFLSKEGTCFDQAKFLSKGGTFFSRTEFSGEIITFDNAQFSGEGKADFIEAKFFSDRGTYFRKAKFSAEKGTYFKEAKFSGKWSIDFAGAEFSSKGGTFFSQANFSGEGVTDFSGVDFLSKNGTEFNAARFLSNKGTRFVSAHFTGKEASFFKTEFSGEGVTDFSWAEFSNKKSAYFMFAEFAAKKGANFTAVKFLGEGVTDFSWSQFSGDMTLFEGTQFQSTTTIIEVRFLSKVTSFNKADLKKVSFQDTLLENVTFRDAKWEILESPFRVFERPISFDEKEIPHSSNDKEFINKIRFAEDTNRNLKLSYRKIGDYDMAGSFFIGEMECKRKKAKYESLRLHSLQSFLTWIYYEILRFTSGYGERVSHVVIFSGFVVVFIASLINWLNGITTKIGVPQANSFWDSLYFSVVTFTTLGFGDFKPYSTSFRLLAAVEALIGAFMIATFVLVFARKMTR